jgi:DNA polymerase-3 subunit epsilon
MNFKKDLLLIDLETTGLDASKHEIIQLAAVLLDKKTLWEKRSFNAYIKPRFWQKRDRKSMAVNKITWQQLSQAPDLKIVLRKFKKTFNPKKVVLSYYVGIMDVAFLSQAFKQVKVNYPFDYHTFNLWGLFYPFMAKKNRLNNRQQFAGFGLEDMMQMFKIKSAKLHDALEDCRVEAAILRKVLQDF